MVNKKGRVYFGAYTTPSGKKGEYVGATTRPVYRRVGEHIGNIKMQNKRTFIGRQKHFQITGSMPSNNVFKAEKTVKANKRKAFFQSKK